jgi:hypothetical protein
MAYPTRRAWATALAAIALAGAPALAQDRPPQGIGFAQAEEGTWLCRHDQPDEALSCARELCIEQASGQECWQTAWCYPANWSGLMTVWLADFHTTHVLCGAPSEASLTQALAAICAGDSAATRCDVTMIIDPEGKEKEPQGVSFAGPAAPAAPDGSGTGSEVPQAGAIEEESPAASGEPLAPPAGG